MNHTHRPSVAVFVKIAHPIIVRVLSTVPTISALILDGEHGAFTDSDLELLCGLLSLQGCESIVRIAQADALTVGRTLDRGADGIMIPRARNVGDVRQALQGLCVPPAGTRGWDPTVAADDYGARPTRRVRMPRCLIQIETQGALEDAEEIARVDGVTDLFVGPADLSRALGSGDEIFSDKVLAALESLPSRVQGSNVRLGAYVDSPARAQWAYALGYRFFAVATDARLLATAAQAATAPVAHLAEIKLPIAQ